MELLLWEIYWNSTGTGTLGVVGFDVMGLDIVEVDIVGFDVVEVDVVGFSVVLALGVVDLDFADSRLRSLMLLWVWGLLFCLRCFGLALMLFLLVLQDGDGLFLDVIF